jgi:lysylphosphatidylglycerol synthetase-like protein (DUF2156 family)
LEGHREPYNADMHPLTAIERFAHTAEQTAALQGRWSWFRATSGPGFVPYRLHFGTALIPGSPLCPPDALPALLDEFLRECGRRRWHAVFAPADVRCARVAAELGCAAWKLGEEPVFDLAEWTVRGHGGEQLRAALNHARRQDVCVDEADGRSKTVALDLRRVYDRWQGARTVAPLGFVLGGSAAEPRPGRRWIVAWRDGTVLAFVTTSPLFGRNGIAIDNFVRRPGAERGSVEAAIVGALRVHAAEGADIAVLPIAPLRGIDGRAGNPPLLVGRDDRSHRVALAALRWLRKHGDGVYRARSLERFKLKFNPSRWEPLYLVHYPGRMLPRMALSAALELLPGGPSAWASSGAAVLASAMSRSVSR